MPPSLPFGTSARPLIRQLDMGRGTNAYLVIGQRPILVDTGWGMSTEKLEQGLAANKVLPQELALIILTHGHGDHAGGAKRMRELSGAPVLAQEGDVTMLSAGHNRPLHPMGLLGRMLRGYSDKPFPGLMPDIAMEESFSLAPYGVQGVALAMPGHTAGSLAVLLPEGNAIVGDMLRGGSIRPSAPRRHLFHDDCKTAESHIGALVHYGVKRFYVGHGGPVDAQRALDRLGDKSCPKP